MFVFVKKQQEHASICTAAKLHCQKYYMQFSFWHSLEDRFRFTRNSYMELRLELFAKGDSYSNAFPGAVEYEQTI